MCSPKGTNARNGRKGPATTCKARCIQEGAPGDDDGVVWIRSDRRGNGETLEGGNEVNVFEGASPTESNV